MSAKRKLENDTTAEANTTPQDLLDAFAGDLARALKAAGANNINVRTAPDPRTALELMAGGKSDSAVAVVFYESDAPDAEIDVDGACLVDSLITVGVVANPGMKLDRGKAVMDALGFANRVRVLVLKMRFHFGAPVYAGMNFVRGVEGSMLAGYAVSFRVKNAFGE